jgi:hypothetical protein
MQANVEQIFAVISLWLPLESALEDQSILFTNLMKKILLNTMTQFENIKEHFIKILSSEEESTSHLSLFSESLKMLNEKVMSEMFGF